MKERTKGNETRKGIGSQEGKNTKRENMEAKNEEKNYPNTAK